ASSNEQDEELYFVEFSRNSSLNNNELESDNESIDEIQIEENVRGRGSR
ncbi:8495_t:CDS:1, partial [Funneliformis geosporum]